MSKPATVLISAPIGKYGNKIINTINPSIPNLSIAKARFWGSHIVKIREPSNGGIGKRLKIPRRTLRYTTKTKKSAGIISLSIPIILTVLAAKTANTKLVKMPAKLTQIIPILRGRKTLKFTGTGFAQAKINPPRKNISAGNRIDPKGSMCEIGLSVNRPALFAVSSPNQRATKPWATSWKITETIKTTITIPKPTTDSNSITHSKN